MFLSQLVNKQIFSGPTPKGVCRGVGISLKSHAVKYLLCASSTSSETDFSVSASAVEQIGTSISLSKIRPLFPKNCARIFLGRPVYAFDGAYLGNVSDLQLRDFVATTLFTDQNEAYPVTSILACQDAVLLKREPPYPIGQRVPTPFLSLLSDKNDGVVTKTILRAAIEKNTLIKLTLSLPPFALNGDFVFGRKL